MAERRRGLSFLERNQRVIGLIALVLIVSGTGLALLLQGGVFTPTYSVTALFTDAAGMREGDNVTVAGIPAGKVKDLRLEEGRVAMELAVEEDVELPSNVRAEIVIETLLGRQSVALLAGDSRSDEPLSEGDVIPLERTTTPVSIINLNDISVRLLEESDAEALEGFLRQVSKITKGKARDVQALITGLDRVAEAVDARRDQLSNLLESLRTLSVTLGERDQTIVSLIDNLDAVLGNLAQRQDELQVLLESTDEASHETADLVRRNRGVLDATLRNLHANLQVLDDHQLDLAAGVAYLNKAVRGYSSVGYSAGGRFENHWANIFIQSLGPLGVDAIVGECGLVDQLFDRYFGTDCNDSAGGGAAGSGAARPPSQEAGPAAAGVQPEPLPGPPVPPPVRALPCTIEDVVGSVLAGTGLEGPAEGCEAP